MGRPSLEEFIEDFLENYEIPERPLDPPEVEEYKSDFDLWDESELDTYKE